MHERRPLCVWPGPVSLLSGRVRLPSGHFKPLLRRYT